VEGCNSLASGNKRNLHPTDREKWETQVVPLFEEQGLNAGYWGRPQLDALLDKYPEVERSFFQNEVRVFLTLPEVRERFRMQSPLLQYGVDTGFFGRESELAEVHRFLRRIRSSWWFMG